MIKHVSIKHLLIYSFFILSLIYIGFNIRSYVRESLQMDFSDFYTAGQSVISNLNPYRNNVVFNTSLWDGIDRYKNSRYLYPPLVAYLFTVIARIPYFYAKAIWILLNILLIFVAQRLVLKALNIYNRLNLLFCVSCSFVFYPTLTFFERGQIDLLTLILAITAVFSLISQKRKSVAGILLALAAVIKLNCAYLFPFFMFRSGPKLIASFLVTVLLLLVFPAMFNLRLTKDYFTQEFPRISKYGEGGTDKMLLANNKYIDRWNNSMETTKDNKIYLSSNLAFISNASLSRTIYTDILKNKSIYLPPAWLQFLVFSSLFFAICVIYIIRRDYKNENIVILFVYFLLATLTINLTAPQSWSMNLVWLIVIFPWLLKTLRLKVKRLLPLSFIILGVCIMGIPDYWIVSDPHAYSTIPYDLKYIVAEIVLFCGLAAYLLLQKRSAKDAP